MTLALFLLPSALATSYEVLPGVVADLGTASVYVMSPGDRIEALDAASGATRWSSQAAAKPLAVVGDHLVALQEDEEGLRVVVLSVKDGARSKQCGTLALPPGAPRIDAALGAQTETWAHVNGDEVVVNWSTRTWYSGGPQPTPEIQAQARSHTTGALACKPATGAHRRVDASVREERAHLGYGERVDDAGIPAPKNLTFASRSLDGAHLLLAYRTEPDNRYDTQLWDIETAALLQTFQGGAYSHRFLVVDGVVLQMGASKELPGPVLAADSVASGERAWERVVRQTHYTGPMPP